MRIDIISAVPDLLESPFKTSILKRALEKGLAEIHFHNVRDFAFNKHRQIDDTVYGGGAGMVMMCEPLDLCISQLKVEREYDDKGSMATIGKHRAVVDLPKFKFQGIFAWYFWMFLHLMLILSVRNKLAIFFNWMWSYINRDSSLRLIIIPNKKNKTEQ